MRYLILVATITALCGIFVSPAISGNSAPNAGSLIIC